MLEDLAAEGLLAGEEVHHHALGTCYRCDTVVELLISKQWFVRMKPLAEPAAQVVREGKIRFVPERFAKIYLNWVDKHQGLVYLAAALVGAPDPGLVLPGLRYGDRCR